MTGLASKSIFGYTDGVEAPRHLRPFDTSVRPICGGQNESGAGLYRGFRPDRREAGVWA